MDVSAWQLSLESAAQGLLAPAPFIPKEPKGALIMQDIAVLSYSCLRLVVSTSNACQKKEHLGLEADIEFLC